MRRILVLAAMGMLNYVRACLRSANLKRALVCSCLLAALVMCGLTACGSSDDENGGQPTEQTKNDESLTGNWIEWTSGATREVNQAMSFSRGGVLMYLQKVNSAVTGGWYHAEYTITGKGLMRMDVTPVNMREFKSFDECDWFVADPAHAYLDASYRISGDELHIVFADNGKEIVLKKEE